MAKFILISLTLLEIIEKTTCLLLVWYAVAHESRMIHVFNQNIYELMAGLLSLLLHQGNCCSVCEHEPCFTWEPCDFGPMLFTHYIYYRVAVGTLCSRVQSWGDTSSFLGFYITVGWIEMMREPSLIIPVIILQFKLDQTAASMLSPHAVRRLICKSGLKQRKTFPEALTLHEKMEGCWVLWWAVLFGSKKL